MDAEYLAFDPGKTTGFVRALVRDYRNFDLLETRDIAWGLHLPFLNGILPSCDPQALIIEDFRLYAHAAEHQIYNSFPSVKVIGFLEALAFVHCPRSVVVLQMPVVRKNVKILEEHVGDLKGLKHSKDAYRHLRYYLVTNRIDHSS